MKGSDFNRFSVNPVSVDIPRARFERNFSWTGTFNAGDFIPCYVDEILPGDTFSVDTAMVTRMSTPIHPVMGNANQDTYFFAVPCRLLWKHWREFMGQAEPDAYSAPIEYTIPQIIAPNGFKKGSVADMMGLPTGVPLSVNALYFRAVALVWNEWFRDQNTMQSINIPLGDEDVTIDDEFNFGNDISDEDYFSNYVQHGAEGTFPLRVAKYHDYFTSALPLPQKGEAVQIGLLSNGFAPLSTTDVITPLYDTTAESDFRPRLVGFNYGSGKHPLYVDFVNSIPDTSPGMANYNIVIGSEDATGNQGSITGSNLGVNINESVINSVSINMLRQAFQLQKMFEKDARGGTRYVEIIKAHFGVTSPDARQQRPEYLGGKRVPITMQQVLQTSATNEISPQGNTAAYSLTQDADSSFTKSFTEHTIVIGFTCIRQQHMYQQGVEKMWLRKNKYDFYDPIFANIGEQPIRNIELFAQGNDQDNEVFGYQEAWADYRYKPSRVVGALRSNYAQSLDVWTYADDFSSLPTLSPQFISATKKNIDRTLAVPSATEDQFICDMYFKNTCVRPMPLYSIPGLIDHH